MNDLRIEITDAGGECISGTGKTTLAEWIVDMLFEQGIEAVCKPHPEGRGNIVIAKNFNPLKGKEIRI